MTIRHLTLPILLCGLLPSVGTTLANELKPQDEGELLRRLYDERGTGDLTGFGFWRRANFAEGWTMKSRIWHPALSDAWTLGLFPLDPVDEEQQVEALLEEVALAAPAAVLELGGSSAASRAQEGLVLADANTHRVPQSALAVGESAVVAEGRYGGALRLGGGKSAMRLPNYNSATAFTVEGWFKPERLAGTLMHVPLAPGRALVLTLLEDGQLELSAGGKPVGRSTRRLREGVFSHVALSLRRQYHPHTEAHLRRWTPRDVIVVVDGFPQIWIDDGLGFQALGAPLLGNTPGGADGFAGLVDDVRVSAQAQDFYEPYFEQTDPHGARAVSREQPVMRGRDGLLLDAPLDGTLAADGSFQARALPAGGAPRYAEGFRSKGVVVDSVNGVRFTPAAPPLLRQGSLEFWFMPEDWDNNQSRSHEPAKMHLNYKAPLVQLQAAVAGQNTPAPFLTLAAERTAALPYGLHPLQPGRWNHVVLVWRGHEAALYINGQRFEEIAADKNLYSLQVNRAVNPEAGTIAALDVGGFRGPNPRGATIIDEVKLYGYALTPVEIANAYQRFLPDGAITPLPPVVIEVAANHPRRTLELAMDLLMPERHEVSVFDVAVFKRDGEGEVAVARANGQALAAGNARVRFADPALTYGDYRFDFVFKDRDGKVLRDWEYSHSYPQPAWVDNTLGLHEDEVMPPWTPMTYADGVIGCWGREISIGGCGWPVRIVSQGETILPAGPVIHLVTDQGEITLSPRSQRPVATTVKSGAVETEGELHGGGWTVRTHIRTEFDGFMKLQARFEGPTGGEVRALRVSWPLAFAEEQMYGFYTGEHWFRAAHDFRLLPRQEGVVFASNDTGRGHPKDWQGKVSFLPYVTVGDDWRQFVWLAETDRHWTQSWEQPAITIAREGARTWLNLNLIQAPVRPAGALEYTFGLQATPIRPLEPDHRRVTRNFNFIQVCGFNGHYMQGQHEGHLAFRLTPRNLDWSWPEKEQRRYQTNRPGAPLYIYFDRTWQRAPEDALEYNPDWRGWGNATRYTKPVRDAYAWYINEWLRRGLMDGMYIDDAWINPTKALSHLDPADNLAYRVKEENQPDFSHVVWGFEFFDYRELLKRIRWLFLDNNIRPMVVVHITQTPYYPIFAFTDIMLEGEDRYLKSEKETRDFITSWGLPRLRYASPAKWGIPVQWLPILSVQQLQRSGFAMERWYYQQRRAYAAGLLLHDVSPIDHPGPLFREAAAAGFQAENAEFIGYWEPSNPVKPMTNDLYASLYRTPEALALVIVNAVQQERVVDLALDADGLRALLGGAPAFAIRNADGGVIPPPDEAMVALQQGIQLKPVELADQAEDAEFDALIRDIDEDERRATDPDSGFEHHNFRYDKDVLRLRIQGSDYRLLIITPAVGDAAGTVRP